MEKDSAISALGALAQATRLDVFRLLVRHEPDGLAAGEIARQLDVPQNTMSAHLGILARAGIVRAERQSRSIIYRADLDGLRAQRVLVVAPVVGAEEQVRTASERRACERLRAATVAAVSDLQRTICL